MNLFDEIRPASLDVVSWFRRALRRELQGLRISDEIINDILLAVSELLTNTIVHSVTQPKCLRLAVDIAGANLRVEIEDDGTPFADFEKHWNAAKGKELAATEVSGLGLVLARATLTNVTYTTGPPNRIIGWHPLGRSIPAILLVEDDPTLLMLYTAMLKRHYRVFAADSLVAAKATVATRTIDLIVCDFHVGTEIGTSLLQELDREVERLPIPIIMVSGDPHLAVRTHAEGFGIDEFLLKPVTAMALRAAIDRALHASTRRMIGILRHFGASADKLLAPPPVEQLAARSIACRFGNATAGGGDFMMYFPMPFGDRIVLVDVMGHGLAAKAVGIAYAAAMRTVQLLVHGGAAAWLTALSEVLRRDPALAEMLATVLVVDRDRDGILTIASAAHPPPLLISAGGIRPIDVGGPVIGLIEHVEFQTVSICLAPGERLALLTDGVEPVGLAGGGPLPVELAQLFVSHASSGLQIAIGEVEKWLVAELGPSPRDDWTVILLEAAATTE